MSVLGWIIFGVFALVFPWAFDRVCMYISKKTTKHEYGIEDTYEFYKKQYDEIDRDIKKKLKERERKRDSLNKFEKFKEFLRKPFGGM